MSENTDIKTPAEEPRKGLNVFEKYLTLWVLLCIAGGIALGRVAPDLAKSLDDMAILVRASHQMRAFEDRFLTIGLPYRVIGGPRFYERMEIRDAMAYFRVAISPDDDLAFASRGGHDRRLWCLLEDHMAVRTADAERTNAGPSRARPGGPYERLRVDEEGALIEAQSWIGLLEVQARRDRAVLDRQHCLDEPGDPCSRIEVAEIGLHRPQGHAARPG